MLTQSSQKSQQVSRNSSGSQPSTLGTQAYAAKKKEVPFVKQVISIDDFNQEEKGEGNGSKNIRVSSAINSKNVVDNKNRINESNTTNDKKVVKNSYHNIEVKKTDRNEIIQKGQVSHGIQEKQQLVQQKASEHYLMQLQMKEQMKAIQKAQQLKQQQAKELNMLARKQVIEQLLSQNEQQEGGRMQIKPAEINTADRYRIQKSVDVQDTQKYKLRESQGDRNMQTKQAATEQSSSNNLPKIQTSNSQVENDKKSIRKHPQSSKSIESHEDIQGTSNNNIHSMQRISGGENGREINIKSQNLSEKHIQINNFSSSSSNNNSQAVIQNNSKRLLKHSTESERFPILNKGSQVMKEEEQRAGFDINKSQKLKESQRIQKNKKNEEIQSSKVVQQEDNNQKYKRHYDTRDQDESDENGNDQKSESEDNQSESSNNSKSEDDHFGHDDEGQQESNYKAFGQFESKPVKLQDNSSKLSQESNEQQEDDENEDEVVEREEDTEEGDQDDSDKDHEDQDSQCSVRQKHEEESREEEQEENQSQENDQQDEQENEEEHEGQQEEEEDDDGEQQQQFEHSDNDDESESEGRNEKKINNLDDNLTFGHHKGSNKQLLHQNFQTFGPNRNNSENISLLQTQKQDNTSRNVEQSQSMQQARNYQDNINNQSIKRSQGNNLEGYQNSGLASTSAFGVLKDKMRELKGGSIKNKGKQTMNEDEEEENSNIRHESSEGSREEQDRNSDDDNESDEGGYQDQDQYEEENDKQNEEQEEPEWIENKNSQISLDQEEGRNGRNSFDMKFHMAYEQSQEQSFKAAQESQSIEHNQDNHEYGDHEDDNDGDAQDDFWQGKSSKLKSIKNQKGMDASELQDNEFIKHSILAAHRQTGQQSNLSAKSAQPKQSNHRKAWEKHQQTQQIQGLNWERKSQQQSEENDNDDEEEEDEAIEKNGISEDTKKLSQNELEQEEDNSQQQQQQQVQQQPKGVAMTINFDEDDEDVEKKKKIFEQLRHRKTQEFEINKQKKRLAEQQNQQQQAQQPKEQQYSQQKPQAKSPIGARKTVVEDSLSQAKERQSLPNRLSQISNKPSEKQEKKGTLLNDPIKDQFMLPQKTSSDYPTEKQPKNKTSPGILKKKQATVLSQDKQNTEEYKIKTDMADNFAPRPSVSETPTTKPRIPFQKASNKLLISQAISKVCMAGPNQKERETVLNKIKDSPYEHFIVLFKGINGRQDFKAIYAMDNNATEIKKIYGLTTAPQIIESSGIQTFFRYDSGAKEFKELLVKGFSSQVDAILLKK